MFCEIGLEEYPAPAGFGAGNETALGPGAQLLGVHLEKVCRLSQGEGNHDGARELIRSASSSSALQQSSRSNRSLLRRQPKIISVPSKTRPLSKHLFGAMIGAGSAEPSTCSKASLRPYAGSSSSVFVLPKPVFSTTCESRSIRMGVRSVVGSEGCAALSPRNINGSRAKRPRLVTGSLIVLITGVLLIGVDGEFETHRLHAPTGKGDATFRANGPSIAWGRLA